MTEASNIHNTVNINLDATLGISDTEAANFANTLKTNLVGKNGITEISYANGQLEVKGTNINGDALADKLKQIVFSSNEMKAFFNEDIKNVTSKQNSDGTITLTTNGVSDTKKISDFDIRELMKLLIAAFSELRTADRERALNILNATVVALENKISAMETAAKEQYKSAIASAVGQIVSGAVSITVGVAGGAVSGVGQMKSYKANSTFDASTGKLTTQGAKIKNASEHLSITGQTMSGTAMPLGKIIDGSASIGAAEHSLAKSEADIEATKADASLEILRQAQDQYTKGSDSLQQFIDKILSLMQQLLQSASQTEKAVANI